MQTRKFVIDPGSGYMTLYGDALLYRQPNVAVVRRGRTTEVLAYGDEALNMRVLPDHSVLVRPVQGGIVKQPDVLGLVLKKLFEKFFSESLAVRKKGVLLHPRTEEGGRRPERPGGRVPGRGGSRGGSPGGRGTESSLTDCDRSNSKKRASKPGRPGGRHRANEREGIPETDRRKIIRNNYHEEFDPGSG